MTSRNKETKSMLTRRCLLTLGALAALSLATAVFAGPRSQAADPPLEIVASFSILGDMVKTVGGDRVQVITLVGPNSDAHVFEPTPADARAIADAKVVFINGLGLEQGWMPRLIEAAGYKGPVMVTSKGIKPLRMDEEEDEHGKQEAHRKTHMVDDPHAWQNLVNGNIYVKNIVAGLSAADPAGAGTYRANGQAYISEIDELDAEVRAKLAAIPQARRKIVTTHNAFQYFGKAYGVALLAPEGVSTEAEASAEDVARLIRQIRKDKITALFFENMSDNRLLTQISKETGAKIGGTVYSDALSAPDGPAPTYLAMLRHNLQEFTRALVGS
jgi:zinc/manganese transport system substrate-binding protein